VGPEQGVADVCVIGAGPAGSTLAARMALLGYDTLLVERASFPRRHLGESLSPGVLALIETFGAREAVERAGFWPVPSVQVTWGGQPEERRDPGRQGLLVDRGQFDWLLLEHARRVGVRVMQPAAVRARQRCGDEWMLSIEAAGRILDVRAAFLADASGRSAFLRGRRVQMARRTLALYGYWRGRSLPRRPRIESGTAEWYWGVPIPDGSYNTLVFVDEEVVRGARGGATQLFHTLVERSSLMRGCRQAHLASPVLAADATPYLDEESATPLSIKVGDAALALDPLSSSGVQKAIQTALAGAVVVNTLLRRPESREAAIRFYLDSLRRASERHCGWAAEHYGTVAARTPARFWQERATTAVIRPTAVARVHHAGLLSGVTLELSRQLAFVDEPCLEKEFVAVKTAVRHPNLDGPIAYLGPWELAPLLREVGEGRTPYELALAWSRRMPPAAGLAVAQWLLDHGVLVPENQ
jgi:flavin-dependent dehydrogenase